MIFIGCQCGARIAILEIEECPVCQELFGPCCLGNHDCASFARFEEVAWTFPTDPESTSRKARRPPLEQRNRFQPPMRQLELLVGLPQ